MSNIEPVGAGAATTAQLNLFRERMNALANGFSKRQRRTLTVAAALVAGLVLTIYNWARPRDLSHYESFEHYHSTFYKSVEALSVTPFAPRAIDRGLTGVLVALVRHSESDGVGAAWNPEAGAQIVPATASPDILAIRDAMAARGEAVTGDPSVRQAIVDAVDLRLASWGARQTRAASRGAKLTFRGRGGDTEALLRTPAPGKWGRRRGRSLRPAARRSPVRLP